MASPNQIGDPPKDFPNVPPAEIGNSTAQTRALVKAIEDQIADIKSDVKDIKSHRHADFVWMISVFGGGFLLLAGLILGFYWHIDDKFSKLDERFAKLEEKVSNLATSDAKIDTKLDDLIARIPPVQNPVKTK